MRWLLAALAVVVVALCWRTGASAAVVSPLPSPLVSGYAGCGDCLVSSAEVDVYTIFIPWLEG